MGWAVVSCARGWSTLYGWESTGGAKVRVDTLGIDMVAVEIKMNMMNMCQLILEVE